MKNQSSIYVIGSKGDLYYVDIDMPFCECKSHYFNRLRAYKKNLIPEDCKHIKHAKEVLMVEKNKNNKTNTKLGLSYESKKDTIENLQNL